MPLRFANKKYILLFCYFNQNMVCALSVLNLFKFKPQATSHSHVKSTGLLGSRALLQKVLEEPQVDI